jgi:aminopeptidase
MEFESDIAQKVVETCLRIKPEEIVYIESWHHTMPMAEELALACIGVGAIPSIRVNTDKLIVKAYNEIPEEVLRKTPKDLLAIYEHISAFIDLGGPEDPNIFDQMKPEGMNATAEAFQPLEEIVRKRSIRSVFISLGNCTPQRAKKYGIDYQGWMESIKEALSVDYEQLSMKGNYLAKVLADSKTVHVTSPSGTDLKFELMDRPIRISDGIIDDEDLRIGTLSTDLPTGLVSVAPDENSAHGTVIFPNMALWGKVIKNQKWVFENGKLVNYQADKNDQVFDEMIASAKGAKDRIASFGIGINPKARPTNIGLLDWMVEGVVSIGVGENLKMGGTNDSTFQWSGTLLDANVELNGIPIIQNGKFTG